MNTYALCSPPSNYICTVSLCVYVFLLPPAIVSLHSRWTLASSPSLVSISVHTALCIPDSNHYNSQLISKGERFERERGQQDVLERTVYVLIFASESWQATVHRAVPTALVTVSCLVHTRTYTVVTCVNTLSTCDPYFQRV